MRTPVVPVTGQGARTDVVDVLLRESRTVAVEYAIDGHVVIRRVSWMRDGRTVITEAPLEITGQVEKFHRRYGRRDAEETWARHLLWAYASQARPARIDEYARYFDLPPAGPAAAPTVTWAGVTTLLIADGTSAVLTDGFFSRPSLLRVGLGQIAPSAPRIDGCLGRLGVRRLDAVLPVHTHFDHALDSAVVAQRTGATLVGGSVGGAHRSPATRGSGPGRHPG